jgi:Zn-dependent protease with chaperone function
MPAPASSETDASARFFDGKRAAPHDVTLGFADGRLIIRAVGGSLAVEWPVRSIVRRSEPNPERTVTLGQRRGPARLEIDDPGLLRWYSETTGRRWQARTSAGWRPWLVAIGTLPAIAGVGFLLVQALPRWVAPVVPVSWQAAIGSAAEHALLQNHRRCDRAAGQEALERLAAALAHSSGLDRPVQITVVDNAMINAFALPGDRIVVMRGLIGKAEDGSELAGVLAHEMGHILHRDPVTLLVRRTGLAAVATALGVGGGWGNIAGFGNELVALSYGRAAETNADDAAIRMLHDAGLRSDGLGRFFALLEKRAPDVAGGFSWLSDHPSTAERRARAAGFTEGAPPFTADEWAAVRHICSE